MLSVTTDKVSQLKIPPLNILKDKFFWEASRGKNNKIFDKNQVFLEDDNSTTEFEWNITQKIEFCYSKICVILYDTNNTGNTIFVIKSFFIYELFKMSKKYKYFLRMSSCSIKA